MKLAKRISLVTVGIAAAMAIFGVSSALAIGSTALCQGNELVCLAGNTYAAGTTVQALSTNVKFLSSIGTVACTHSIVKGKTLEALSNPLKILLEEFDFLGCKLGATLCNVSLLGFGHLDFLKLATNLGSATFLNMSIRIQCGGLVNCTASGSPVLHLLGTGGAGGESEAEPEEEAKELEFEEITGFACPKVVKWDVTYFISQPTPMYIAL